MPDQLKFGLTSINTGATSYPEALVRLAQAAETAGFDSLWAGEHHVSCRVLRKVSRDHRLLNPVVALTFVAAHTRTIRLGTGILLLPQHQTADPGEGTGQPGCPFRRSVDSRNWRGVGRGRVRGAGRPFPGTGRSRG